MKQNSASRHHTAAFFEAIDAVLRRICVSFTDRTAALRHRGAALENLESRTMLAANAAPTAKASATTVTDWTSSYSFKLSYKDDKKVNTASIDSNDVLVTGPNGYARLAKLVGVSGSGKSVVAKYKIPSPGTVWDSAANGTYTIAVRTSQVTDSNGRPVLAGVKGKFVVDVAGLPDKGTTSASGSYGAIAGAVNITKFGATPNDSTDDTAAIQAAINSLPYEANGLPNGNGMQGGIVYLPAGTYNISKPIMISGGVALIGDGTSTVLNSTSTSASDSAVRFYSRSSHGYVVRAAVKNLSIKTAAAKGIDAIQSSVGDLVALQMSDLTISSGATAIDMHGRDVYQSVFERINVTNPGSGALYLGVSTALGNVAVNRVTDLSITGTARSGFFSTDALVSLDGDTTVNGLKINDIGARVLPIYGKRLITYRNVSILTSTANLNNGVVASFGSSPYISFDSIDNLGAGRVIALSNTHEFHVATMSLADGGSVKDAVTYAGSSNLIVDSVRTTSAVLGAVTAGLSSATTTVRSITSLSGITTTASSGTSGTTGTSNLPVAGTVVYASAFGANGSDAVDDTAAIQAAIDSLPTGNGSLSDTTTGGMVVLPVGRMQLSKALRLPSGVWLSGTGYSTYLYNTSTNASDSTILLVPGKVSGYNINAGVENLQIWTSAATAIRADASVTNGVFNLKVHDLVISAGGMSVDLSRVKTYHSAVEHIGIYNAGSTAIWMGDDAGFSSDNKVVDIQVLGGNRNNYLVNRAMFVFEGQTNVEDLWVEQATASVLPIYLSGDTTMHGTWLEYPVEYLPSDHVVIDIENATHTYIDRLSFVDYERKMRVNNSKDVKLDFLDISGKLGQLSDSLILDNNSHLDIGAVNAIRDAGMLDDSRLTIRGTFNQTDFNFVDTSIVQSGTNLLKGISDWVVQWGDGRGSVTGTATIEQTANGPRLNIVITSNPLHQGVAIRVAAIVPISAIGKRAVATWRVDSSGVAMATTNEYASQYSGRVANSMTAVATPGVLTGNDQLFIVLPWTAGVTNYSISNLGLYAA